MSPGVCLKNDLPRCKSRSTSLAVCFSLGVLSGLLLRLLVHRLIVSNSARGSRLGVGSAGQIDLPLLHFFQALDHLLAIGILWIELYRLAISLQCILLVIRVRV